MFCILFFWYYFQPLYIMKDKISGRRQFVKKSVLGILGAGISSKATLAGNSSGASPKASDLKIKKYNRLGRTGFEVSDISSGAPKSDTVLRALLRMGVNYIDTGETYGNGNNEKLIGEVIQEFDRSKLFITSKLYTEKSFTSKQDVLDRSYACLERLQTDYVDCMMIHSAENSTIVKDENFHAAMEQLKKEGRVRHLGISCHGNQWAYDIEEGIGSILKTAIDDGRFDVLLLAYNFMNANLVEDALNACEQKSIGTAIMKSNPIKIFMVIENRVNQLKAEGKEVPDVLQAFFNKYSAMYSEAFSYFEKEGKASNEELVAAAMKYILTDQRANTIHWDFANLEDVQAVMPLSGTTADAKDLALLNTVYEKLGHLHCRMACNVCLSACPHKLPVNKMARYQYYYSVKGRERYSMEKFNRLQIASFADACGNCPGYCEQQCPYGVQTRSLLALAYSNLQWT